MSTPPPIGTRSFALEPALTVEQIDLREANRSKAKAALQERDRLTRLNAVAKQQPTPATSNSNGNGKRPLQAIPADSTSPTNPHKRSTYTKNDANANAEASGSGSNHFKRDDPTKPLKNLIGSYVDYDLALLKNSKGGFLLDNEEDDPRKIKERQLMEKNKQARLDEMRKNGVLREPAMALDPSKNPKCSHCRTMDIDYQIQGVFGVIVCSKCKAERPDEYSLLTKTECKEDYLLTDPELKDADLLPHLLRPNPHRPTYSNMMLFLRLQVEAFAFSDKKWGSPEALDAEFARREAEKKEKKGKKFEKKLRELRRGTKTTVWHKRIESEHIHEFVEGNMRNAEGHQIQRCAECDFEIEVETF